MDYLHFGRKMAGEQGPGEHCPRTANYHHSADNYPYLVVQAVSAWLEQTHVVEAQHFNVSNQHRMLAANANAPDFDLDTDPQIQNQSYQ
mmetsp:Transcript_20103/g.14830  ORF Transcript_20103/g.14830 Transcript_20103/m.14830 type:complete len:89 (+) Transcript_20103:183-449(+)